MTSEIQNTKPEDEGEHAVNGRVLQLVADEVGPERLQDRPADPADDGASDKAPRPHHRRRQYPVTEDELATGHDKGEHDSTGVDPEMASRPCSWRPRSETSRR